MRPASAMLATLSRLDRPPRSLRFIGSSLRAFDVLTLALPILAFLWRWKFGRPVDAVRSLAEILAWIGGLALAHGLLRIFSRKGDPMRAARGADAALATEDRILTAADHLLRGCDGLFVPLLVEVAERDLRRAPALRPPADLVKRPAFLRILGAAALAFLILAAPSAPRGLFGPDRPVDGASAAARQPLESGDAATDGTLPADSFAGKVEVTVSTNRDVYLLGEEIPFKVRLTTLEPNPAGVLLEVVVRVDGEKLLTLPIHWELPTEAGAELQAEVPLAQALRDIDAYRAGLLTFDTYVRPEVERPGMGGVAVGNRWTIQISENARRLRTPTPMPMEKKPKAGPKKQPEPRKQPEKKPKEEKPPEAKQKKPGPGPGEEPPRDLGEKPFVVDPLFAGNQTEKREVKVYDRDKEKAENPPPPRPEAQDATRPYDKLRLTTIEALDLPGRERRLLRRYVEALGEKQP